MSKELEKTQDYQHLVEGIGSLLTEGRRNAAYALNTVMVETYWHIGQYIVEYGKKEMKELYMVPTSSIVCPAT